RRTTRPPPTPPAPPAPARNGRATAPRALPVPTPPGRPAASTRARPARGRPPGARPAARPGARLASPAAADAGTPVLGEARGVPRRHLGARVPPQGVGRHRARVGLQRLEAVAPL